MAATADFLDVRESLPVVGGLAPTGALERLERYKAFYGLDGLDACVHEIGRLADYPAVVVQTFTPLAPRGTVFLLHGYYDHVGIYAHPIRFFLGRGAVVVSYDQPGHGLSGGPRATIESFREYVDVFRACLSSFSHLPRPWVFAGQSLAASVIMTHLLAPGAEGFEDAAKVCLLAPLVHPAGWGVLRWVHRFGKYVLRERPRSFVRNSSDEKFLEFLQHRDPLQARVLPVPWITAMADWIEWFERKPPLSRTLYVYQGTLDRTVDWRYSLDAIERKFADVRIRYIGGAGHQLVNESDALRAGLFAEMARDLDA